MDTITVSMIMKCVQMSAILHVEMKAYWYVDLKWDILKSSTLDSYQICFYSQETNLIPQANDLDPV